MLSFGVIIYFMLSFNVIILDVFTWCYHLVLSFAVIIYLMLSFDVIISHICKCYHFCVIIFPCTAWVLSFMLPFNVIIFCYHFPPFSFSWKRDTLGFGQFLQVSALAFLGWRSQANPLLSMNNYTALVIGMNDKNKQRTLLTWNATGAYLYLIAMANEGRV